MKTLPVIFLTTSIALGSQVIPAQAFELGFTNKTNGAPVNVAPQLKTTVEDLGSGKVKFTFTNSGTTTATITDINFGKSNFSNFLSFQNLNTNLIGSPSTSTDLGVNFTKAANPGNLPGGKFGWNPVISFKADSPGGYLKNGVDNGEFLSIIFELVGGKSFADIEDGFKTNTLAIGTHVQAINQTHSDWFESQYQSVPVPEPLTILGTVTAFGFGSLFKRKYGKKDDKSIS
jgi:hypothetical protein